MLKEQGLCQEKIMPERVWRFCASHWGSFAGLPEAYAKAMPNKTEQFQRVSFWHGMAQALR